MSSEHEARSRSAGPSDPDECVPTIRWARARLVGLVGVGGAVGTLLRYAISDITPPTDGVPVAAFGINVVGAFLLALLLGRLARRGGAGRGEGLRLLLGTGVMGGFTTYSALAVDTVTLLGTGAPGRALAYAGGTVVLGALATALGMGLGERGSTR